MSEKAFKSAIGKCKYMQKCTEGEEKAFYDGLYLGLNRGFHGELFQCEHDTLIAIPEDSPDPIRRAKGKGYRQGFDLGLDYSKD